MARVSVPLEYCFLAFCSTEPSSRQPPPELVQDAGAPEPRWFHPPSDNALSHLRGGNVGASGLERSKLAAQTQIPKGTRGRPFGMICG